MLKHPFVYYTTQNMDQPSHHRTQHKTNIAIYAFQKYQEEMQIKTIAYDTINGGNGRNEGHHNGI